MKILTTQERALAAMLRGENCALLGPAGSGKTETVRRFCLASPVTPSVTASTGIAAINARGRTLHSFCGMGLGPNEGQSHEDFIEFLEGRPSFQRASARIRECSILIIDEVSMLTGATFGFVDRLFRHVRWDERPFGGVQLIVVGDFLQLAPVNKAGDGDYDWCFDSPSWDAAGFTLVNLKRIWRQDEPGFLRCLGEFRAGRLSRASAELLRGRVIDFPDDDIPRLFTHNRMVDKWNRRMLDRLPGEDVVIPAALSGPEHQLDFLRRNMITPEVLVLRDGARVMMTANVADQFVNGQVGTVAHVSKGPFGASLAVDLDGGGRVGVERQTWRFDWQDPTSATFTQLPVRLAWATTIHKAQGLTLDRAFVDIRAAREPGQGYTALSRVRRSTGVYLKAWFNGFMVSRRALEFYRALA